MKTEIKTIILDPKLKAEIDSLSPRSPRTAIQWTKEMDEVVLYGFSLKDQHKFSEWFKKKYGQGGISTLRRRYQMLKDGKVVH